MTALVRREGADKVRPVLETPPHVWTLRPSKAPQVAFAIIGIPLIVIGVLGARVYLLMGVPIAAIASGLLFPAAGIWLLTEVSTARIHLSQDRFWMTRRGRVEWSAQRDDVELERGQVGARRPSPGFHVFDRSKGQRIGRIFLGQFNIRELTELEKRFPSR